MRTPPTLDDVLREVGSRVFADEVPVNVALALGRRRLTELCDVTRIRTDVRAVLRGADRPRAMLAFLLETSRRGRHTHRFERLVGALGDASWLRVLGVRDDLTVMEGCATSDNVSLARALSANPTSRVVVLAAKHGSVGMLEIARDLGHFAGPRVTRILQQLESPKDLSIVRWLIATFPADRRRELRDALCRAAYREGRVDLLEADADYFWSPDAFLDVVRDPVLGIGIWRFAHERIGIGIAVAVPRMDAARWLRHHERDRVPCLELHVRARRMELTAECFAFVRTAAELDAIVRLGAPWPDTLGRVSELVVEDAVLRADCPAFPDWTACVRSAAAVRACVRRGWPIGRITVASTEESLIALVDAGAEFENVAQTARHLIFTLGTSARVLEYLFRHRFAAELWDVLQDVLRADQWCNKDAKNTVDILRAVLIERGAPAPPDVACALMRANAFAALGEFARGGLIDIDERVTSVFTREDLDAM